MYSNIVISVLCFFVLQTVSFGEDVLYRTNGTNVYAFDSKSGKGRWSDDGIIYSEEQPDEIDESSVPFFTRSNRLYALLLSRDAPNILISLDLRAEGRLLWRHEPMKFGFFKFERFLDIKGDSLRISGFNPEGNRKIVIIDVATGLCIDNGNEN